METKIVGQINTDDPKLPTKEIVDFIKFHKVKLAKLYIRDRKLYEVSNEDYLKHISRYTELYGTRSSDRKVSKETDTGTYTINRITYPKKVLFGYSEDYPNKVLVLFRTETTEEIHVLDNNVAVVSQGMISKYVYKRREYCDMPYHYSDIITVGGIINATPYPIRKSTTTFAKLFEQCLQ